MQCCTCSKWVHLKCSLLSSKFSTLGSSHSWSCPLLHPYFFWRQHCDFPLGLLQLVYLHYSIWPTLLMQHSHPTPTFYPPSVHFVTSPSAPSPPPHAPGCISTPPASSSPRVLQWNAGGLRARSTELLHFLSGHPIDLICIQESNLNSSSLSGSLDSLLCDLIAPTPDLAFSLPIPRMLVGVSSFLSGRVYPSWSFLPPPFLCLTPTLIT